MSLSINAIPDLNKLSSELIEAIKFINKNKKNMSMTDIKFKLLNDFHTIPGSIINLLTLECNEDEFKNNIKKLIDLLTQLKQVKNNSDLETFYNLQEKTILQNATFTKNEQNEK